MFADCLQFARYTFPLLINLRDGEDIKKSTTTGIDISSHSIIFSPLTVTAYFHS